MQKTTTTKINTNKHISNAIATYIVKNWPKESIERLRKEISNGKAKETRRT